MFLKKEFSSNTSINLTLFKTMNIIIINHYAGSPDFGMEFRPYYLAKEWIKLGHKVTIIAADFSHLRKQQPLIKQNTEQQNIDGINYIFFKTPPYKGNGKDRVLNMFSFVKQLTQNAKKIANTINPNIVIASSTYPADIYPAKKIAKISGAKLIFEIHDVWPLTPMELGGFKKYHPFIATLQYFENFAYRHSNAVVSILPNTKQHCLEHKLDSSKWYHIPNGIVVEEWSDTIDVPLNHKELIENLKNSGKKIIGYVGGHGISNALNILIETAKIIENQNQFAFVLVGDGQEKQNLLTKAQNLKNVYFLTSIAKKSVPSILKMFDFLYIGWNKSKLYRFGISPNKVFDYMMSAKPIIHSVDAANDDVAIAKCGISVEAENPQAIAQAIIELSNKSENELLELGENGKKYVLQNNDYSILAKKFIDVTQKC